MTMQGAGEARRRGKRSNGDGATKEPAKRSESRDAERDAEPLDDGLSLAAMVAACAKAQLAVLTGYDGESVVGIERHDKGWYVTIDLVELEKVPCTADILGTYRVDIDDEGELRGYRRMRRYVRGRADEELDP